MQHPEPHGAVHKMSRRFNGSSQISYDSHSPAFGLQLALGIMISPGTRGIALADTRETRDKSNKNAIQRKRTILMFRRTFPHYQHFIRKTEITRQSWQLYRITWDSRENHNILCIRTQDRAPENVFGLDWPRSDESGTGISFPWIALEEPSTS